MELITSNNGEHTINNLPKEIIGEVLGRLGASSPFDLFRCKLSSTTLREISEDNHVMQQVSIDKLLSRSWLTRGMHCFITRCQESNNPEAFLHLGLIQYFTHMMLEEGMKNLERSAQLGNKMAAYVLGLIFLCTGDEEGMERGTNLLINIMRMIGGEGIVECRKKLLFYQSLWWFENKLLVESVPKITCEMQKQHDVPMGWGGYYDGQSEDRVVCVACKCARGIQFFKAML